MHPTPTPTRLATTEPRRSHGSALRRAAALVAAALVVADSATGHRLDTPFPTATVTVDNAETVGLRWSRSGDDDARSVGLLLSRRVSVVLHGARPSVTVAALQEALEIPILAFLDGDLGAAVGLDADRRVDLTIDAATPAEVFEAIAEAYGDADATWQVIDGRVEIGPRFLLGRASARRPRALDIDDLTHATADDRRS